MPLSFFEWSRSGQNAPVLVPTQAGSLNVSGNSPNERNVIVGDRHNVAIANDIPEGTRAEDISPNAEIQKNRMEQDTEINQRQTQTVVDDLAPHSSREQGPIKDMSAQPSRAIQNITAPAMPVNLFEVMEPEPKRKELGGANNIKQPVVFQTLAASAIMQKEPVHEADTTRIKRSQGPANPTGRNLEKEVLVDGTPMPLNLGDEDTHLVNKPTKYRKSSTPTATLLDVNAPVLVDTTPLPLDMGEEANAKYTRQRRSEAQAQNQVSSLMYQVPQHNVSMGRSLDQEAVKAREKKTEKAPSNGLSSAYHANTSISAPPLEVVSSSVATRDNKPTKDAVASVTNYQYQHDQHHRKEPFPIETVKSTSVRLEGNMPRYVQPFQRLNEVEIKGQLMPVGPLQVQSNSVTDKSNNRGSGRQVTGDMHLTEQQSTQFQKTISHIKGDQGPTPTRSQEDKKPSRENESVFISNEVPLNVPPVSSISVESNLRSSQFTKTRESQRGRVDMPVSTDTISVADMDKIGTLVTLESKLAAANARLLSGEKHIGRETQLPNAYFKPHADWHSMHDIGKETRPDPTRHTNAFTKPEDSLGYLKMGISLNQRPVADVNTQTRMSLTRDQSNGPILRKDARAVSGQGNNTHHNLTVDRAAKPVEVESTLMRGAMIKHAESVTERTARGILPGGSVVTEPWTRGGQDTRSVYKQPAKYIKNMDT